MITELKRLLKGIAVWFLILIGLAAFLFTCDVGSVTLWGRSFTLPVVSHSSFAVQFFDMIRHDLIPDNVRLIVTTPLDAFLIQVKTALFLSFIVALPLLLWSVLRYISPALTGREKGALYKIVIPSSVLFIAGSAFAYAFVIPMMFRILYSYAPDIQAETLFNISDFVSLTFGMMAITGLMFLMPVCMVLCSWLGIIQAGFWKHYWRQALFAFIVITAVITPDGSGITMLFLAIPLTLLYIGGIIFSIRRA